MAAASGAREGGVQAVELLVGRATWQRSPQGGDECSELRHGRGARPAG